MSVTVTKLWQADCDRCGWHTRQAEGSSGFQWVQEMAEKHRKESCPEPFVPRNGGILACGCWAHLMSGATSARPNDPRGQHECPNGHGRQAITQCNVEEPTE